MRVHASFRRSRLNFICLLLTYTLNISLFAPFAIKPAKAMLSGKTKSVPATIKGTVPATTKAQETTSRWRDRELLVRFREHAPISKINALLRAQGAQWNGQLRGQSGIERLRLSGGTDPEAVAARLRASELVDFAESNYLITADQTASQATTNDPRLSEQWALQNTVSPQAWRLTTGSKQTVIAVVDSGIDFSHPDLIHNQWDNTLEQANTRDNDGFNSDLHGWDFITNSSGIVDEQGHGTAVAGIIAAQGNNSLGITGVMWQASMMSLRVLDKTGTGDIATAVEAIDYATTHGAQVINCSWGTDDSSQALREAINRAAQRGVVVITSAGNSSRDIETTAHYPASYDLPNVIAVAATDKADVLTPSSNWGALHVSIAAPGAEILTTQMGGKYQTVSGTSASAPFVAGVAGLIKSLRPWLNVERTRESILRGARQVASLSDKVTSKGVVSVAGAAEVLNTLPPNEGTEENGDINGGERGNNGNNGNGRSNLINTRSDSGNRDGSEFRVTPPARTQGAPGMGLPNLDELRGKQSTNPKAADPIPSTRCSHKDPECAPKKSRAAIELPTSLLAWGFGFPFKPSYSEDTSGPVSDSPFSLFRSTFTSSSVLLPLPQTTRTNVALASNGGVASASSIYSDIGYSYTPGAAINDERKGLPFSSNLWHDAAPGNSFSDWLQVDFNGTKIIDEVDVYTLQDNYTSATEPTESMTFSLYGLTGYEVQYWNGSGWLTVPGGSVTGNNKVWKKVSFSPITTTRIRVLTNASGDGYSRITEVEAWGVAAPKTNFALSTNGSEATASSTYADPAYGYTPVAANNDERKGSPSSYNLWHDAAPGNSFPDWLQIEFSTNKSIEEIDVFTLQDNYSNPVEPTETTTFSLYGLTGYEVQYWTGTAWVNVPGGSVTGNNKVWRKFNFLPVVTKKIRILTNASGDGYSRITEVEAWGVSDVLSGPQSVVWTNIVGVTPSGNNLSKASGFGWDAGAVSQQTIASGDGYAEFTATEANKYRTFGLSSGDSNQNYTDIDFAIELSYDGHVSVYEAGVPRGTLETYTTGDHFRVSVVSGVVKYSKNGTVFYTSTVAPVYPLLVDTSLYTAGATITNAIISAGAANSKFAIERLDPINRTGSGDVDLLSRNANWSLPILGLKGRAGLDLGLSLSYNSLVWTKSEDGAAIKFDADQGTPSPGFRLGFPTIQQRYYNAQVGVNAYLLITPSGSREELRQVGTSNVYESADSSYLQLVDDGGTMTLRSTDGSQLTYALYNGQYQCTKRQDRNGNFITVSYHTDGRIDTITDTLARVITFVYDEYLNIKEITQNWNGTTYKWATFGWGNQTIQTSLSGLTVVGPQNNTIIPVLTSVSLGDGTYTKFRYNSWGQVDKVTSYAADSVQNGQMMDTHPRNYSLYTLTTTTGQDCPRVTEQKVWAENWNNQQEATTSYSTALDYSSGQMSLPTNSAYPATNIYKETFATTGWQKGLTTGTEFWSGSQKMKWTTTAYTQDNTALTYLKNPRVIETNVYDSDNKHKRTTVNYDLYAAYGLPHYVDEYQADGVTLLRRTYTDYNLSQAYLDRRIIGLPSAVHMSDGTGWQVKVKYEYDATGDYLQATSLTTAQHDANYGTGLTTRGNLTSVSRYDVTDSDNESLKLTTRTGYNTNGSIIFTRDHLDHGTSVNYADSFSYTVNQNTYAYPTIVTDADGNSSTIKYNYHLGATMETKGPPPVGYTAGASQTFEYDSAGRISRVNNTVNGAYQRWVYGLDGAIATFTTIQTGAPEAYNVTYLDGAGRLSAQGGDNPNSTGLYSGQFTAYDIMGRVSAVSNPTEMNASWIPTGDDAAGWVYTQQAYDWKSRPTITTNPDGTTKEATYGGCGCAGGEVVTVRDEVGREQRMTADVLGRPLKTEVLDKDANQTVYVYSAVTNNYNARDQVTSVVEAGGGASQTTTMTYDGYGRLKTRKAPSQTYATTYAYNGDDTVQSVTDARGAVSAFTYNNRHLPTGISYTAPTAIKDPDNVIFTYDAVGNRTSMTDESGNVAYNYDQLSRLTSESRQFAGLTNITRTLSYQYNLANELTSITDPFGEVINYAYDKTGRVTDVSGSSFGGVTQYASNARYRAWGGLKSLSYGNSKTLSIGYSNKLQTTTYEVSGVLKKSYQYYNDGRLKFTQDDMTVNSKYDRFYEYDHMGRIITALSGAEARKEGQTDDRPYNEIFSYDQMNHLTQIDGRNWDQPTGTGPDTYVDDKRPGWIYDEDGRVLSGSTGFTSYDAAGKIYSFGDGDPYMTDQQLDTDGRRTKSVLRKFNMETNQWTMQSKTYYVTSSVLGGTVVSELTDQGAKAKTFVYGGGKVLALQTQTGNTQSVRWEHMDASGGSFRTTNVSGQPSGDPAELDPMGADAKLAKPFVWNPPDKIGLDTTLHQYPGYGDLGDSGGGCTLDGMPIRCSEVAERVNRGAATIRQMNPTEEFFALMERRGSGHIAQVHWVTFVNNRIIGVDGGEPSQGELREGWGSVWIPDGGADASGPQARELDHAPQRTKVDPNKLKAVDECLMEIFRLELISFIPSNIGKNGEISVGSRSGDLHLGRLRVFDRAYTITTDATTKRFAEAGRTYWETPYTNYTTNNRHLKSTGYFGFEDVFGKDAAGKYFDTQIHELGNSISAILTTNGNYFADPKLAAIDVDSGYTFASCVAKRLIRWGVAKPPK